MDLVSVIVPYYKKKNYISSTIKSIINQSYKKIEIIIIYDDSNKFDLKFIKRLTKNFKQIKIIVNKKNIGVAKSRNIGIKKSKGKYIAFLDSDDLWKKNKLKLQLDYMKKNNCLISHTDYEIISRMSDKLGYMQIKKDITYDNLINSCDIGLSTVIISSKIKSKIKFPNIKTKEDFVLWLKLSKKFKFCGIQKNLVSWRKNENSIEYSLQKIRDAFVVYYKYEKFNLFKSIFFVAILSLNFIKKTFLQKITS